MECGDRENQPILMPYGLLPASTSDTVASVVHNHKMSVCREARYVRNLWRGDHQPEGSNSKERCSADRTLVHRICTSLNLSWGLEMVGQAKQRALMNVL